MVTDNIRIHDKWKGVKKVLKVLIIIFVVILILLIVFILGFGLKKSKRIEIILENPLKNIVFANTNVKGEVNKTAVINQGIIEFDEEFINYILVALGTKHLHKSLLFENPLIEFDLSGEIWNSEIIEGMPNSKQGSIEDEDLKISISKEEAVESLLAPDIEQFLKDSVNNGNTKIEMVAGKTELFTKGYLTMYKELTGEEIEVE